jgi:hypothetical protein
MFRGRISLENCGASKTRQQLIVIHRTFFRSGIAAESIEARVVRCNLRGAEQQP